MTGKSGHAITTYGELNSFIESHKDIGCELTGWKIKCEDCPYTICKEEAGSPGRKKKSVLMEQYRK